jgi:hypothetical protein
MTSIFEKFENLPTAKMMLRRHDLGEGGYALLTITERPGRVSANLGSTKIFPPVPMLIEETDIKTAVAKIEAKFVELHPGHVCTEACYRHWETSSPDSDDPLKPPTSVN